MSVSLFLYCRVNVKYENIHVSDDEFYYEFKCDEVISENDFPMLEEERRGKENVLLW